MQFGKKKPKFINKTSYTRKNKIFKDRAKTVLLPILKGIASFFSIFVVVAVLIFIIYFFRSNNFLKIISINLTDQSSNSSEVLTFLNTYKGISMFNINNNSIQNAIKDKFPMIKNVYITKLSSGELDVEVVNEVPKYIIINYSGVYLLNPDGKIIQTISSTGINLDKNEAAVLNGSLSIDDDFIKSLYFASITDPVQKAQTQWDQVPINIKQGLLDTLKNTVNTKINNYFTSSQKQIESYKDIQVLYKYSTQTYNLGDTYDKSNLVFIKKVLDSLKLINVTVLKVTLISDYTIQISTTLSKDTFDILFTNQRDINTQITDLNILIYYNKLSGIKLVDLRSNNYSLSK